MAKQTNIATKAELWELPLPSDGAAALSYFHSRERPPVDITLVMKLHKPSKWKTQKLLQAHEYVSNLKAKIYAQWQEDPEQPRDDGALAEILKMLSPPNRAPQAGEISHAEAADAKISRERTKVLFGSRTFGTIIQKRFPQPKDSPFHSRLYEGVCRDCAQQILRWAQEIIKTAGNMLEKKVAELSLEEVYQVWREQNRAYTQAATTIIPFGRNRGKPLAKYGKREARWLLKMLLPEEDIAQLLKDVDLLLDDYPSVGQGQAMMTEHPWQRDTRHRRGVRENRLFLRVFDPPGDLTLLGNLHRNELADLRKMLGEMHSYITEFKDSLERFQAALVETQEAAATFQSLAEVLETYLYAKPLAYPTVNSVDLSDEHRVIAQDTYSRWLGWYQLDTDTLGDAERFLDKQEEQRTDAGMLAAAQQLEPPRLQPLPFIGAMHPGQGRDFALLYDRAKGEYVLAVVLHKSKAVDHEEEEHRAKRQHSTRQLEQQVYSERRSTNPLYYVNYPETQFKPPKGAAIMLFTLEYGMRSNREPVHKRDQKKVLDQLRASQRQAQEQAFRTTNKGSDQIVPIEKCLPKTSAIATAKIVCRWDEKGRPEFYLHASAKMPVVEIQPIPTRIIGITEHENGYAYAVLELDGAIARREGSDAIGDLIIPRHVDPKLGAKPNSDNYVFEVAHAIIAKAAEWNALIALEDTLWKKERSDLSRESNHQTFRRPSGKIMATVEYKTRLMGLLDARLISNVSPVRDCSKCRTRLKKGTKGTTFNEWQTTCPSCQANQVLDKTNIIQNCQQCKHSWEPKESDIQPELVFACPKCNARSQLARYNTALVVAQKVLVELAKHHRNAIAADQRRAARLSAQGTLLSET